MGIGERGFDMRSLSMRSLSKNEKASWKGFPERFPGKVSWKGFPEKVLEGPNILDPSQSGAGSTPVGCGGGSRYVLMGFKKLTEKAAN